MSEPYSFPSNPAFGAAVLGVAALNRMARDILERALPLMWVRGEVSNFTCAASGHCYFTLKDAGAQVRCAMFRNRARLIDWQMRNGMLVEVRAVVTLYEARGEFQLTVEAVRRAGTGALYEAFERLKAKLAVEGLFDPARKRSLPSFPRAIGVVTSTRAAALRDVLTVLRRRMPSIPVIVYPTPVQGDGAGTSIAAAIHCASERKECDVLLLCRGGGSIEDLWAFNEEVVARAMAGCSVPVVSGIGHETDFTIADFVADLRAPTPSAAAETVSPDREMLMASIAQTAVRMRRAAARGLQVRSQSLDFIGRRLVHPGDQLREQRTILARQAVRLTQCAIRLVESQRWKFGSLLRRVNSAAPDLGHRRSDVQGLAVRLSSGHAKVMSDGARRIAAAAGKLETLNPHAVLARGYSIAMDAAGNVVRDASVLKAGDSLQVTFARGAASVGVEHVEVPTGDADA